MNISENVENIISELIMKKSANLTGIRQPVDAFNEPLFNLVKGTLVNSYPNLNFGSSHSEGRFWIL
jgi:hypothetical protein